jgi:2,3-bisphosphoglycerate-dependent phosphoglycerate mutase
MIEFLVVRHGQSTGMAENRHGGRADFPLSELGLAQSRCVADWIAKNYRLDRLISSPQKRATQTAQLIAQACGVNIEYDDDLREYDSGVLGGMLKSEAAAKYPKQPGGRRPHESLPGGETMIAFRARAETFFSRLMSTVTDGQRIAIVTHEGTISMLFRAFLALPMDDVVWLVTAETGIHLWQLDGARRRILLANSRAHLDSHG